MAPNETPVDRNVQGTSAESVKAAWSTSPPETPAKRPIVSVMMIMKTNGWMTAHAMPSAAYLYFTRMLRSAKAIVIAR
jgi:hypothetical protein